MSTGPQITWDEQPQGQQVEWDDEPTEQSRQGVAIRPGFSPMKSQGEKDVPQYQFEKDRPGKGISSEGVGSGIWDKLSGLGRTALNTVKSLGTAGDTGLEAGQPHSPRQGGAFDPQKALDTVKQMQSEDTSRKEAGYNPAYRALAPVAQVTGVADPAADEADAARGEGGKILGREGTGAALAVAPSLGIRAVKAAREALPSTQRAGAALEQVKAAAGSVPIDMTKPGNTALELYTQSQRGASLPKVVRDFVMRATKPGAEPITYEEAKDFQSNASKLSAEERMQTKPNTLRLIGQLNSDLKDSLEGAAARPPSGDMSDVFSKAMKEYRKASQMKETMGNIKDAAVKSLPYALTSGALGYLAKKYLFNREP